MTKKLLIALLATAMAIATDVNAQAKNEYTIDLAGTWSFSLQPEGTLPSFHDNITLPGTTDTNRKGTPLATFDETTHLSRRYSYTGRAWYQREVSIPQSWAGLRITLLMERTKFTQVYVDGRRAGHCNDISTPQRYNLSALLTPGTHTLTIMVSNAEGVPQQIYANSHAYTEDTQTNWNGIIGRIELSASASGETGPAAPATVKASPITVQGHQLYQDGHRLFLRGRHDACVWPLTGHVAMDLESWRRYMKTCTDYGLNHVRFHSWCPPEAAFVAADEAGIILQPELPFWGDFNASDSLLMTFLHKEGLNILREYGHHPSFRMFALGNELWGSIDRMADFIADFRRVAPDKLFTYGSNYYLGYQPPTAEGQRKEGRLDYFTTCRVGGEGWGNYHTHTRGSFSFADAADGGIINHFRPNTSMNFEQGCLLSSVPIISHETAQFQTYPDYDEIDKYTGVLRPCNLETFRQRLADAGMADQAKAFHRASGLWSYQLYKQDVEMDLRTPSMAGFQLLDLQDYPGQGSAYVGMLDAFLDSKGLCTPQQWRQFCAPVVPLAVMQKYCYQNNEPLDIEIQIANYGGQSLKGRSVSASLGQEKKEMAIDTDAEGLVSIGKMSLPLSSYTRPTRLELSLTIEGTPYRNTWPIWVYPSKQTLNRQGIIVTHEITDEIGKKLQRGARVLLMPDSSALTVGSLFQTDYWNYRMFKTICQNNQKAPSPGTLGILCDPQHPLFADYPTEEHTNWQWWPVVKESHPFILDNTGAAYRPVVQVIDNIERNHKLGLVFEFTVGQGRLLVVMSNLERAAQYPEGRQFYASVLNYMRSAHFAPSTSITLEQLHTLFATAVDEKQLKELNNISPY